MRKTRYKSKDPILRKVGRKDGVAEELL